MANPIVPVTGAAYVLTALPRSPGVSPASPATYSFGPGLCPSSSYALAGAAGLGLIAAGCWSPPQPAQQNNEARIPRNQLDCPPPGTVADGGTGDPFCDALLRTEQRVDDMRAGRDEYNNHNTILVELGAAGGALGAALLIGLFFGGRWWLRKRARSETAVQKKDS